MPVPPWERGRPAAGRGAVPGARFRGLPPLSKRLSLRRMHGSGASEPGAAGFAELLGIQILHGCLAWRAFCVAPAAKMPGPGAATSQRFNARLDPVLAVAECRRGDGDAKSPSSGRVTGDARSTSP